MNRRKLVIPGGLLFFIMLIWTSSGYETSKFLFVLRHLLLFLLVTYLVYEAQVYTKDYMIERFKFENRKEKIINVSVGLLGVVILFIISSVQIAYIEAKELKDQLMCHIYGPKDYLIYISDTPLCPDYYELVEPNQETQFRSFSFISEDTASVFVDIWYGDYGEILKRDVYFRELTDEGEVFVKIEETSTLTKSLVTIEQKYYYIKNPSYTGRFETVIKDYGYREVETSVIYEIKIDDTAVKPQVVATKQVDNGDIITLYEGEYLTDDNYQQLSLNPYLEGNASEYNVTFGGSTYQQARNMYVKITDRIHDDMVYGSFSYSDLTTFSLRGYRHFSTEDKVDYISVHNSLVSRNQYRLLSDSYTYNRFDHHYVHVLEMYGFGSNISQDYRYLEAYDYEQMLFDFNDYDNYAIYRKNPIVDYVFIVLGGDVDE